MKPVLSGIEIIVIEGEITGSLSRFSIAIMSFYDDSNDVCQRVCLFFNTQITFYLKQILLKIHLSII